MTRLYDPDCSGERGSVLIGGLLLSLALVMVIGLGWTWATPSSCAGN